MCGEDLQQKPTRKRKGKYICTLSEVIMKQCRKVLRCAVAADEEKVFCNLLGRTLLNTSDNDDEGLIGFPTMVPRPLDFRTVDLRLASGAYGGSHEAFLEDVREVSFLLLNLFEFWPLVTLRDLRRFCYIIALLFPHMKIIRTVYISYHVSDLG